MSGHTKNNTKGIVLMVAGMAMFAITDLFIKLSADTMSPAHATFFLMGGGLVVFYVLAKIRGEILWDRAAVSPVLLIRYLAEVMGSFGIVIALATTPISTVGAILQASPLVASVGAVLLLGEQVRLRQWVAIGVGFCAVLLVLRPTGEAFDASALWAVLAMMGLAGRDLTTRLIPPEIGPTKLATFTMAAVWPVAIIWCFAAHGTVIPEQPNWFYVVAMVGFGAVGYLLIIASLRAAEVSVVTPFRYTRLIFLLAIGVMIFEERPDAITLLGAVLIVATGFYAMTLNKR